MPTLVGSRGTAPARVPVRAAALARPWRIALVSEYYYPHVGGVVEHVHYLAREARRRGHHVDIITSHMPDVGPRPNVVRIGDSLTVHANGSLARVTVGRGLRSAMRRALRRGRYDVVHVHAPLTPSLPMLAVEEAEVPLVGTFHAYYERSFAHAFGRRYFQRHVDRLAAAIAVSPAARDAVARYFDADWTIIPNGVDTELFRPDAPPPPELCDDVPTVLHVGRFDPRNGLPVLVDAFRRLRERGVRARLVVVGDGPERERYHRLAADLPEVRFVGRVPDGLPGYYAGSAVYACPAVLGSFGITLLEAMSCSTPIVCYDTPGFRAVVRDGVEALLTPPNDAAALADALARLLGDAALRARLAHAGRARALAYAWPAVADAVLDVYARVLGVAPPARATASAGPRGVARAHG